MLSTMVVQPVDLLKTRMQLSGSGPNAEYKNVFDVFTKVLRQEGVLAFYNGCVRVDLFRLLIPSSQIICWVASASDLHNCTLGCVQHFE